MTNESVTKAILQILDIIPELKEIFLSSLSLDDKRRDIRRHLAKTLDSHFEAEQKITPLEWVMARDATAVMINIFSARSDNLAEFSLLRYINDWAAGRPTGDMETPGPGFLAELEHLFRGVAGKTGIYSGKVPRFLNYEGMEAAKMRSASLSRWAQMAQKFMNRYRHGLEEEIIERRKANKKRILDYFKASEEDWLDWKWQVKNIIRGVETLNSLIELSDEEYQAVKMARENRIPFGITPYYLSLMDYEKGRREDNAVRAQVIPPLRYIKMMKAGKDEGLSSMDFMLERDTSPQEGITRRYPMILIIKPILTCPQICVYCQRNWEIEDVYSANAVVSREKLDEAIEWIANTPEIMEVLVTGGDPFLLADDKLDYIMKKLSAIDHVERIRVGTRTPVTLPMRMTDELLAAVRPYHVPGRREICIVTHFEHASEVTPEAMEAVQKFRLAGIDVYNQLVYTFNTSRKFEAALLRHQLRLIGVSPYYTFNTKGKEETDEYRVPIARLLQEQREEARLMPGTVRTDEIVFNVPRLGKNYLRAAQNHDVITILPDGRRVYEFHPWEKNLSLVDTYLHTDVSIYDYMERLREAGEDLHNYRTIWYYY